MTDGGGLIFGPILVGAFLNSILYGAVVVQTYVYFQAYKSDKWWMKTFVVYLLFCETLSAVFDIGVVFEPLIIRYGNPGVFTRAPMMLSTNPLLTVMISFPVQLFIAWRVKVMSRSSILPAIITFFAIASFLGGFATGIGVIIINFEYSRFPENYGSLVTWLGSAAAADIIIAASLVYSLLQKRTGFAATDDAINRIIRLTLQTGFVTAVAAILDVTLFLVLRGQSWNYVFDLSLSKLYSNSILSTLNARGGWKTASTMRDNVLFGNGNGGESMARSRTQVEIAVTTDTHSPRITSPVPMKFFGLGASGYMHQDSSSAINVQVAGYGEAV